MLYIHIYTLGALRVFNSEINKYFLYVNKVQNKIVSIILIHVILEVPVLLLLLVVHIAIIVVIGAKPR